MLSGEWKDGKKHGPGTCAFRERGKVVMAVVSSVVALPRMVSGEPQGIKTVPSGYVK